MIPVATTAVTVSRPDGTADAYETATLTVVASRVRAVVSSPRASDVRVGGRTEIVDAVVHVDYGVDVKRGDLLTDHRTGIDYTVEAVTRRPELIGYLRLLVRVVTGASSG